MATNDRRSPRNLSQDTPQRFRAKTRIAVVRSMQPPTSSTVNPLVRLYRHAPIRARACTISNNSQNPRLKAWAIKQTRLEGRPRISSDPAKRYPTYTSSHGITVTMGRHITAVGQALGFLHLSGVTASRLLLPALGIDQHTFRLHIRLRNSRCGGSPSNAQVDTIHRVGTRCTQRAPRLCNVPYTVASAAPQGQVVAKEKPACPPAQTVYHNTTTPHGSEKLRNSL